VNGADNIRVLVIDRVPFEVLFVEVEHGTDVVESLIHDRIFDLGLAFGTHDFSGKCGFIVIVVHGVYGSKRLALLFGSCHMLNLGREGARIRNL
jgi:hypothetical protein